MIIISSAAAVGIGLAMIPFLSVKDLKLTAEQKAEAKGFKSSNYIEPAAVPIALVAMVLYLCFTSIISFLALYWSEIGLIDAASVFSSSTPASSASRDRSSDADSIAKARTRSAYPAIVIFAAGLAIFSQARYSWMILLAAIVIAVGFEPSRPAARRSPSRSLFHRAGLATSTFFLFADIGVGLVRSCAASPSPSSATGARISPWHWSRSLLFLYYALHGKRAGAGLSTR